MSEIHLFEPSGYAGVFQHSCRLAALLSERGLRVTLHTGHEHEEPLSDGFAICPCVWWPRAGHGSPGRSLRIGARLAMRTLPHLRRAAGRGSVLHVEGIAAGGLTVLPLAVGRLGRRRLVYSPHDTFSRRGRLDGALLRLALRLPQAVVTHSEADVEALGSAGIHAHLSPLVQVVPAPSAERMRRWREEWRASADDEVVLFAGWIRPEKRLDVLIESARSWPANRRLAVLGPDRGGWEACARLAHRLGVEVAARIEFTPLADFTSALAAADVVVAPHEKVSQSGVLAVARQLGARTVAAEVGGMPELATRTFAPGDVDGLTRALDAVLGEANGRPAPLDEELAVRAHLRAYGLEVDARPGERRLLMGMPLDALTREEALERVRAGLLAGRGGRVLTPNLDILRQYRETPALAEAFDATELLVADGMPLVWASRLEGAPLPQRVTGSDILYGTAAMAAELGRRVFLAGGRPGVAQRAGERLALANPGFAFTARPCFIDPGPIGAQLDELMDALEADAPDLAYIGLPFAAQVHLMGAMRERLPGTWFVGVGSTFDLVTGDRTRAPEWLQRLGLEWAHRIVHEPHVWRRYLVLGLPLAARLWVHSLGARLRR